MIVIFVVIIIRIIASGSLSSIITTNHNSNQGATSPLFQKPIAAMPYNDVVQYALRKINEDRSRFNIPAGNLLYNHQAAENEFYSSLYKSLVVVYSA